MTPYFQLHRRGILPTRLPARALRPEPLEEASRREARASAGREPAGHARGRRAAHEGPQAGHGRHHAQGHHVSDRRQVAPCRDPGAQSPRPQARNTTGTVLSAHRQAGRDDGWGATPTPSSSTGITASCASCAFGSGGSSATSAVRSPARPTSRRCLNGRSRALTRSVPSSSASAAGSCIPSTLPRSSASARARPAHPTSSASRPRSLPPMPAHLRAAHQNAAGQPL
jgi:hypothetical protein